jgi:predicted metal-dependent RNase
MLKSEKCDKINVCNGKTFGYDLRRSTDLMAEHIDLTLKLLPDLNRSVAEATEHILEVTLAKAVAEMEGVFNPGVLCTYLNNLIAAEKSLINLRETIKARETPKADPAIVTPEGAAAEELNKIISFWDNLSDDAFDLDGGESLFKSKYGYTKINDSEETEVYVSPECNYIFVVIEPGNYWFYEVCGTGIL